MTEPLPDPTSPLQIAEYRRYWLARFLATFATLSMVVLIGDQTYDVARADGLTEDKVARIADGYERSDLDPRQKLALSFADAYLKSGGELDRELALALRAEFSPEALAHLAIALVTFNAASRCAVSLGGMPEDLPVMEIALSQTTC